ncbi:hypothetical protein CDL15_Pgr002151 [Punica granatum]|uniref:Uncharacterized protein n=1 Tax=Punica granatum TaxID=22663 RepID=A0A218XCZ6_PUNGR|nr:hypothetical protein CDL15_Pgr002151 [Punica granatum]
MKVMIEGSEERKACRVMSVYCSYFHASCLVLSFFNFFWWQKKDREIGELAAQNRWRSEDYERSKRDDE